MSLRERFLQAREEPHRKKAHDKVNGSLAQLLAELPAKMEEMIEQARDMVGTANATGSISHSVYPDNDNMTLTDVQELEAYRALHALCRQPDIDVCIKTSIIPASRGYDDARSFHFSIHLDQPYSDSNHKPSTPVTPGTRQALTK